MSVCPICNGDRVIDAEVHEWHDSPEHWAWRLAHNFQIDQQAIARFIELYRAGGFRKSLALQTLHKLLKKGHGGRLPDNRSAWLLNSLRACWDVQEPAWWSDAFVGGGGKGGPCGKPKGGAWGYPKGKGK